MSSSLKTVGFLLLGGTHHILHLIPIAAELSKNKKIDIVVFVTNLEERDICESLLDRLDMVAADIRILKANPILRLISPKLAVLFTNMMRLNSLDALVVAERTTTILRSAFKMLPLFIQTQHGAGGRIGGYDLRLRHFDHVLVPGEKDKIRLVDMGLVSEETCHVSGLIKPYILRKLNPNRPKLFENDQPTVLYAPHFTTAQSSWMEFSRHLLDKFAATPHINFIVAPHIRLFKEASTEDRAPFEAYGQYPNILVDLGSEASTDMTYTLGADIYLGDVSSQVYEFLWQPKPCVFIGSEDLDWQDSADYTHWRFGRVCHSADAVMGALETARADHDQYIEMQKIGSLASVGHPDWNPVERAAKVISSLLR